MGGKAALLCCEEALTLTLTLTLTLHDHRDVNWIRRNRGGRFGRDAGSHKHGLDADLRTFFFRRLQVRQALDLPGIPTIRELISDGMFQCTGVLFLLQGISSLYPLQILRTWKRSVGLEVR